MAKLLSVGEMVIDFLPGSEEASYISAQNIQIDGCRKKQ